MQSMQKPSSSTKPTPTRMNSTSRLSESRKPSSVGIRKETRKGIISFFLN